VLHIGGLLAGRLDGRLVELGGLVIAGRGELQREGFLFGNHGSRVVAEGLTPGFSGELGGVLEPGPVVGSLVLLAGVGDDAVASWAVGARAADGVELDVGRVDLAAFGDVHDHGLGRARTCVRQDPHGAWHGAG
jgi:hypothetical protein